MAETDPPPESPEQAPTRRGWDPPKWVIVVMAIATVVGIWNLEAWAKSWFTDDPVLPEQCTVLPLLDTEIDASDPATVRSIFQETIRLTELGADVAPPDVRDDFVFVHDAFADMSELLAEYRFDFAALGTAQASADREDPRLARFFSSEVNAAIRRLGSYCLDLIE